MKWAPFEYDGQVFDLSHLHPFDWRFLAPAGGKRPEREYKFCVIFSCHCFTKSNKGDGDIASQLFYDCEREHRIFCFDRYELSKQLPDIVRSLGDRRVYHTHHGNFFTVELVDEAGQVQEYEVYFKASRATRRGWLNLFVQSAYMRDSKHGSSQPKKRKIRLDVIAYNTLNKKPINPPK